MPQNVQLYDLLISCPGDITREISLIEDAVKEFNELYADVLGITIRTRHWSQSSYTQSGGKPQALLNNQFVNKCDAAVAIFWTRFGSPTDEYQSGTEEEIELMLQSKRQVFMYFSDKPIPPSSMNSDERKKVEAFREKYKDRGIFCTYSSDDEFKKLFFAHLSMYFLSEKRIADTTEKYVPSLKLMGINSQNKLSDAVSIYPFVPDTALSFEVFLNNIRTMFKEISELNVGTRSAIGNALLAGFNTPVEISTNNREYISTVASQLHIELPDDFFDLGNLCKDGLTSSLFIGSNLKGSPSEIKKYEMINKLRDTISDALKWAPVEKAFSDKLCTRLAVQNCGKAIDENIEITFELPQTALMSLDDFPKFSNEEMGYLLNDCDMEEFFGICSTSDYAVYSDSQRNHLNTYTPRPVGLPGYSPDYSESFTAELNDVFCYSIYPVGNRFIIKLKVDYLKHNTTVAFPTILLLKETFDEIPYKITSQNTPEVVKGCLKVVLPNEQSDSKNSK